MSNNYYHFLTPFVPGTKVRSDQVNSEYAGIETGFGLLPTNPASMSLGTTTLGTEVQGATINDYLVTMPDARTVNLNGDEVVFQATHTNDAVTAATMDVDGTGAVQLFGTDLGALGAGDLVNGEFYIFRFTGSVWQMMNPSRSYLAAAVAASIAAAASAAAALVSEGLAAGSESNAAISATAAQDWAIRAENDPVPVVSGGDGATTFSSLHWAAKSAASSAAGVIDGTGIVAPNAGAPYDYNANLIYRNANSLDTAMIGFTGTLGEFRMSNLAYGGFITMNTTDAAGNFARRFGTGSVGNVGIYSDGNTDTENRWLTLYHQNGTERAAFGHLGSSLLIIRNSINGGDIRLQANDAGGVPRVMMLVDPDGPVDVAYAGVTKLSTTSVGINVPETATIGSNNSIDLIDVGNALNVGAANPALTQHLALDLRTIQSKFNAGLVGNLFINPLGGTVNIGRGSGVTQESINLNVAALTAVQVQAAGFFNLKNAVTNDTFSNTVRFMWSNNQIRQQIGSTTGGELELYNLVNGNAVRLDANDAGGTKRGLIYADPDGSVSQYYAGTIHTQTVANGLSLRTSTPGTPASSNPILAKYELRSSNLNLYGDIGFSNDTTLRVRNFAYGGLITLEALTSAGVAAPILWGVPNGAVELYYAGIKRTATGTDGELQVIADGNLGTNQKYLSLRQLDGTERGQIGLLSDSNLYAFNKINSGRVILSGTSSGAVVRTLASFDPDAGVMLYREGVLAFELVSGGRVAIRSVGNTDTENRQYRLHHANGALRGLMGYVASSTLQLENVINSGFVSIIGKDTGGTSRNMFSGDPDDKASLYQVGVRTAGTLTGALGGFEVRNDLTGIGFERVLTVSDRPQLKVKTADTSRANTTTLVADSHLAGYSVVQNQYYLVEGYLEFSCASNTPGYKMNFSFNSATARNGYEAMAGDGVSNTNNQRQAITSAITQTVQASNILGVSIRGYFLAGAGTTSMNFNWAQNISNANNMTLRQGSWLRIFRAV